MSNNVAYPVTSGTVIETVQQSDGSHRATHRTPETDAILTALNAKVPALVSGKIPVDIGGAGDAQATDDTGSWSAIALYKRISSGIQAIKTAVTGTLATSLKDASGQSYSAGAFTPLAAATTALTVGPTATTTPVALPAATATVYRMRNSVSSASSASWRLQTATPGIAPVIPTAHSTAGTGGTVGDKALDPGAVEVFSLTAAQQTALAAGTLYFSAITPAGGSATLSITPGTAGV